jgi:phosphoribosylformylglycinamidine cyclo-ligase
MDTMPQIQNEKIGGETFLEAIMKPHTPYYKAINGLFGNDSVHGMAHITGGGIAGNLSRIIPEGLSARIDLGSIVIPPIFKYIKSNGNVADNEMLKTFNCGVGLIIVTEPKAESAILKSLSKLHECYPIGEVAEGEPSVVFENNLKW